MRKENILSNATPEQNKGEKPFVIRGHHLEHYRTLLLSGSTNLVVNMVTPERPRDGQRVSFDDMIYYSSVSSSYTTDVVGKTDQQEDRYRLYQKNQFEEFLKLDDNSPVKLVTGQKDKICGGCAVGKHCTERYFRNDAVQYDGATLDTFYQAAEKIGLKDSLTVTEDQVEFSDEDPQKVRSLIMTAGTLKTILRSPELAIIDNWLYDPQEVKKTSPVTFQTSQPLSE
jgi:hypothetical protein